MYCTGGIRCDIYSAFLRQRGYNNLYTLEGGIQARTRRARTRRARARRRRLRGRLRFRLGGSGRAARRRAASRAARAAGGGCSGCAIPSARPALRTLTSSPPLLLAPPPPPLHPQQNYLKQTPGGEGWKGSLFVFDGRLAINPAIPGGETGAWQERHFAACCGPRVGAGQHPAPPAPLGAAGSMPPPADNARSRRHALLIPKRARARNRHLQARPSCPRRLTASCAAPRPPSCRTKIAPTLTATSSSSRARWAGGACA